MKLQPHLSSQHTSAANAGLVEAGRICKSSGSPPDISSMIRCIRGMSGL